MNALGLLRSSPVPFDRDRDILCVYMCGSCTVFLGVKFATVRIIYSNIEGIHISLHISAMFS